MIYRFLLLVVLTTQAFCGTALSQQDSQIKGFRGEFLAFYNAEAGKVMQLAGAVPQEKYSWRPAEGVRSISEVYNHVAGGNQLFAAFITGQEVDFKAMEAAEKAKTSKEEITKDLAASVEKMKQLVNNMSDADLDKPVNIPFLPAPTTARGALLIVMSHVSEHLGQSIAYARMNGITPPWTAAQETKSEDKQY